MIKEDVCERRHGGANTSVEAFESTPKEKRETLRAAICGFIGRAATGVACFELEVVMDLSHQTASARISELLRDNQIHYGEEKRKTPSGRNARVYFGGPKPDVSGQGNLFS